VVPIREIADSWASLYANSAALRSAVAFAHVGALVSGGGCAVASDLGTLRALGLGREAIAAELRRLTSVHRIVIASLAIVAFSGVLLMLADLDAFLQSPVFWIKMALVVALLVNGAAIVRISSRALRGDTAAMRRHKLVSLASLMLWFATTLAGSVLPNVV
jgi:hypothetical protein